MGQVSALGRDRPAGQREPLIDPFHEAVARSDAHKPEEPDEQDLSVDEARRVLHEMRVHETELELQNHELRRCQHELEVSQRRYFDLYDQAPVGYLTLDGQGRIVEANLTASVFLEGYDSDAATQPLLDFIVDDDQKIFRRNHNRLLATSEPQSCEVRLKRGSGQSFWAELQVGLVYQPGAAPGFRAVMSDVTARKRAAEIQSASETRYRVMFEASTDALMTMAGPSWRFTSGNSASLGLFGARNHQDFLKRTLWHYSPERQPNGSLSTGTAMESIDLAMTEGSCLFDWTFVRASGEEFSTTVRLTRMEIDGVPQLHAIVRDETRLRKLEAMLGQTDRLASMGMLSAGVAHEINNPLVYVLYNVETLVHDLPRIADGVARCTAALRGQRGIEGFAAIAGDVADALEPAALAEVVDHASEALAGVLRINKISKALGAFSRVETVGRTNVDLNYTIDCAATMAYNQIKYLGTLERDFGDGVPFVWASEGKLSQVFLNLLINASQALEEGKFESNAITIRTWSDGDDAFAEIKDTGKGIAPENLARIFEPFFSTKPAGKGSGLGLAICRNIVTEFEGDITCESQVGQWTRFVVRLPISASARTAAHARPVEATPLPVVRGRILLIDDEQLILKSTKRLLAKQHDVVAAESGEAARAILEHDQAFDAILCDLMMPEMTGMDLHKWLAGRNPLLAARMAFLSGGAFTAQASTYLAGVTNLKLEKPIEAATLKRVVGELIGMSASTH